ncbi:MAG: UvrD-helicase domain-containing protein [Clostridia bacterium]|nr:UvrD-helicase domain-containing protein [Clostridia bacterium]
MKLTQAQLNAIETKNKTLLLSAAAGSGKTSTLTRRIINSITDKDAPKDISKMLIVTFTRASANDLKTKIFNAISDALASDPSNRHLTEQLIKLGSANISTIDSFYLNIVKQNFSELGLPSSFRICDNSEANLIAKNIMKEVIDLFYDTDSDFPSLCECFEKIRDTENVSEEIFISLYYECMRVPEGTDYLRICAEDTLAFSSMDLLETPFGQIIKEYAIKVFRDLSVHYESLLEDMQNDEMLLGAYYSGFHSDYILCLEALNLLESTSDLPKYPELYKLFNDFECVKLSPLKAIYTTDLSEFAKSLRDEFKSQLECLKKEFFSYSVEDIQRFFIVTSKNLSILYRVISEFEIRFFEEKKKRNILQLTDVKRYALKLVANDDGAPTPIAKAYSEQFTDIYIDEYQDVDPTQDLIFRCISKPTNRFMVGDIKQSIYSFRGAFPQLFSNYRAEFPLHGTQEAEDSDSETIFMSENFRCAKPIIDFTNLICSPIFRSCGKSIGYTDEDDLVFAKPCNENTKSPSVKVAVFAKNSKEELIEKNIDPSVVLPTPTEMEAKYVAQQISALLKNGKKQDGTPIIEGDIAILLRNKSHADKFSSALAELNIASSNAEETQYFQNPDVMMMLCILNAIDNPQRDIYLAGSLRSPIFGFTLDELLLIHSKGEKTDSLYDKLCLCEAEKGELSQKCGRFNQILCQWRSLSVSMPIDKLLQHIFSSDEFVASGLVCEKNASGNGGNLQQLYEYARTFEASSFKGLYNFIEFINNIIDNGETLEVQPEEISNDKVTITTIHKSKGLEFPVCFVCGCGTDFRYGSAFDDLSFEYGLGVAMTISDNTGFAKYTSPIKKILDHNSRMKSVEEEMRILYVALTRAREQLFVTASFSRSTLSGIISSLKFKSRFICDLSNLTARNYMDWILPRMTTESSYVELCGFTNDISLDVVSESLNTSAQQENNEINQKLYEKLMASFEFSYKHNNARKIPAKISVSKLSPDVLDSIDTSVSLFDVERSPYVPDFFMETKKSATAAERGTATHLFLQFCDFSVLKEKGVSAALDILLYKKFIPENLSEIIYSDDLEKVRESELMSAVLNAKKVFREQRFNILLPAVYFTHDENLRESFANEKIAVQGVIDLILVDDSDNIYLYDYKTDRLTRNELNDSSLASQKMNAVHGLQLSYYAKAIEYLFGKAPKKISVYSTHAGKCFDINECSLAIPDDIL